MRRWSGARRRAISRCSRCTLRHRGQRRRRQEHADRAAAVRRARDPGGPARRGGARLAAPRRRRARPLAAHRRPRGRARAGHHHRRRLPLFRHAAAQVHHRRHARPRAVHAQHGHRREHRRRRRCCWSTSRKGLLAQTRRHLQIARLLGIRQVVAFVNKMDLVGYSREAFDGATARGFAAPLGLEARHHPGSRACAATWWSSAASALGWYRGPTLLERLESSRPAPSRPPAGRCASRCSSYRGRCASQPRGYMGRIESGCVLAGAEVEVLPAGKAHRVRKILTHGARARYRRRGRLGHPGAGRRDRHRARRPDRGRRRSRRARRARST